MLVDVLDRRVSREAAPDPVAATSPSALDPTAAQKAARVPIARPVVVLIVRPEGGTGRRGRKKMTIRRRKCAMPTSRRMCRISMPPTIQVGGFGLRGDG
jgi:hypothetical protein